MTTKQFDESIAALKTQIARWRAQLEEKRGSLAELEKKRDSLRSRAIRGGDSKAQSDLDALRQMLTYVHLEMDDLGAEIAKASSEIDELLRAREQAVKDEAWDKFLSEAKEAVKEAAQIEKYLDGFISLMQPHRDRLNRMTQLAKEGGHERSFDTRHLWRRFTAKMHKLAPLDGWTRQHAEYNKSYPVILEHIVLTAQRQHAPQRSEAVNE